MDKGSDYRIIKLEKGPLQRFKNQNLLLKKFGEAGLQVYKAITGKRTSAELRKDLGIEAGMFTQILEFMQDAGMVEMRAAGAHEPEAGVEAPEEELQSAPEEAPGRSLEEIPSDEQAPDEETPPLEEQPRKKRKAQSEPEMRPEPDELTLMGEEEGREADKKKPLPSGPGEFDEIRPIGISEEPPKKKRPAHAEEKAEEEPGQLPGDEQPKNEEEPAEEEKAAQPEEEIKEEEFKPEEEIQPEQRDTSFEEERNQPEAASGLSPVEKIISDKYGDIGLRVYTLIDGQRTAEEIMRDTGLTETKLVEILDFMDEQGIIKLDYPKGQQPAGGGMAPPAEEKKESGFVPMIEGEHAEETGSVPSPLEIPVRAPLDIVRGVQLKAKLMFKYGDKGSRVASQIDGKNDLIDIAMSLGVPLYTVSDVLKFMMENGMIIIKPLPRAEVHKKYGDDGYSVYKKYGKEGLMLYELIGKDLTIKQMADQITTDKPKVIDMFIFIHKVLGIELPLDRDVLAKQLGI